MYHSLITSFAVSAPIVYSRTILSSVFGKAKFLFPNVKKGALRLLSGGKYSKLRKELSANAENNTKFFIQSDGELNLLKTIEDFLTKSDIQNSIVLPKFDNLIDRIDSELKDKDFSFEGFNAIQRASLTYLNEEKNQQFLLSTSISKVLHDVFEAHRKWRTDPNEINGDDLIEKVMSSEAVFAKLSLDIEAAFNRSVKAQARTVRLAKAIETVIKSKKIKNEADIEVLKRAVHDLKSVAEIGSLNFMKLTYKMILDELRVLRANTFARLVEPMNMNTINQSIEAVKVGNIETESKTKLFKIWESIATLKLFESLRPETFFAQVFEKVEAEQDKIKMLEKPTKTAKPRARKSPAKKAQTLMCHSILK